MTNNSVHFSSLRLDWKTPKAVYQVLDSEFRFDHDPCPPKYQIDGLTSDWGGANFVNPPYGRELPKWIKKGFEEWQKGKVVVFLIPSRTDTRWWHDYCMKATEIRFIKGRLKFDNQKNPAPFPSAIIIFKHLSLTNPKAPLDLSKSCLCYHPINGTVQLCDAHQLKYTVTI